MALQNSELYKPARETELHKVEVQPEQHLSVAMLEEEFRWKKHCIFTWRRLLKHRPCAQLA